MLYRNLAPSGEWLSMLAWVSFSVPRSLSSRNYFFCAFLKSLWAIFVPYLSLRSTFWSRYTFAGIFIDYKMQCKITCLTDQFSWSSMEWSSHHSTGSMCFFIPRCTASCSLFDKRIDEKLVVCCFAKFGFLSVNYSFLLILHEFKWTAHSNESSPYTLGSFVELS